MQRGSRRKPGLPPVASGPPSKKMKDSSRGEEQASETVHLSPSKDANRTREQQVGRSSNSAKEAGPVGRKQQAEDRPDPLTQPIGSSRKDPSPPSQTKHVQDLFPLKESNRIVNDFTGEVFYGGRKQQVAYRPTSFSRRYGKDAETLENGSYRSESRKHHKAKEKEVITTNVDRIEIAMLRDELKKQNSMMQALQRTAELALKASPLAKPEYMTNKVFAEVLSNILTDIMLEKTFYPSEACLKQALILAFGVTESDQSEFDKNWRGALRRKVLDATRSKRSFFTKLLRTTFYQQLECPKPAKDENLQYWREKLADLRADDSWREVLDADTGVLDPWGSDAVIAALRAAMHFSADDVIEMNMDQAKFLFYVLDLAMEGKTLIPTQMEEHREDMDALEEKIIAWMPSLTKITIRVES